MLSSSSTIVGTRPTALSLVGGAIRRPAAASAHYQLIFNRIKQLKSCGILWCVTSYPGQHVTSGSPRQHAVLLPLHLSSRWSQRLLMLCLLVLLLLLLLLL
jgi:hypothetical protein